MYKRGVAADLMAKQVDMRDRNRVESDWMKLKFLMKMMRKSK